MLIDEADAPWAAVIARDVPPRDLWPEIVGRTDSAFPQTFNLADELLNHAGSSPDRTAVIHGRLRLSYGTLRRRVLAFAARLVQLGVEPSDRVAIRLPNHPDYIVVWLAIQWVGAIAVSLPPVYRRREIAYIVNHSGARVIICAGELVADVNRAASSFATPAVTIDPTAQIDEVSDPSPRPPYLTSGDYPAAITYITSAGGPLKGAVHTAADLLSAADAYPRDVLGLTSDDVCIGAMSLSWAFGLGALLTFPLRAGGAVALVDSGQSLLSAIASTRATVLFGVPTLYRILLRQPSLAASDLQSLRCCISAAEPLPAHVVEDWRSRTGLDILDGLGTTELTHIFISARRNAVRPGLMGTTVAGYEARIVDQEGSDLLDGTPGLLAVRGPTGALYWRDPDTQRRRVQRGWTLTGDICVRHADGWFEHVRRSDDLILSAGYKISMREVEQTLNEHPDVSQAHVFSTPDATRGALVHARVVPTDGAELTWMADRLQRYLKDEIASFKCPRRIEIVREGGNLRI